MLIDSLCDASPYLRRRFAGAHVVRVPFSPSPTDGEWTALEEGLIPRIPGGLSTAWARPSYSRLVIATSEAEHGLIFVQELERLPPELTGFDAVRVEWTAMAELWMFDAAGLPICLVPTLLISGFTPEGSGPCLLGHGSGSALHGSLRASVYLSHLARGVSEEDARERADRSRDDRQRYDSDADHITLRTIVTFALLNCRNIERIEQGPTRQLQRARQREGRPPLFRWHTLIVRPPVGGHRGAARSGEPLALHWVRGHFKDYSQGGGLFGKARGVYWWSPRLQGKADRIVTKDYEVK